MEKVRLKSCTSYTTTKSPQSVYCIVVHWCIATESYNHILKNCRGQALLLDSSSAQNCGRQVGVRRVAFMFHLEGVTDT